MKWPEAGGWAELDTALCRLGESKPGDVLVIRYGKHATKGDALEFRRELCEAARKLPNGTLRHLVPVVVSAEGVDWVLERMGAREPLSKEPTT